MADHRQGQCQKSAREAGSCNQTNLEIESLQVAKITPLLERSRTRITLGNQGTKPQYGSASRARSKSVRITRFLCQKRSEGSQRRCTSWRWQYLYGWMALPKKN